MRIILASASPRRKELLARLGMEFEIIPALGEELITKEEPAEAVMELARGKAQEVAKKAVLQTEHVETPENMETPEGVLVIGADTVVVYDGKILGKPKDAQDAMRMLTMLAGNTHSVYTGVALLMVESGSRTERVFYEETKVTMYPMSREEIETYVAGKSANIVGKSVNNVDGTVNATDGLACEKQKACLEWEGKAGGYGIQDPFGMKYIKGIEGDYYNVVGLPVARIYQELKRDKTLIEAVV